MPNYNEVETKAEVAKTQAVAQPQDKPQVKSTVKSKPKKGLVERLVVGVIGPDGLPALGSSIKEDVILPAIRNMISESVKNVTVLIGDTIIGAVNMGLYGDPRNDITRAGGQAGRGGRDYNGISRGGRRGEASYIYDSESKNRTREPVKRGIGKYVAEYVIEERSDAIDVLEQMITEVREYGEFSVLAYKSKINADVSYTDNSYGWKGGDVFNNVKITAVRGGYVLNLPPITVIA